jgi:type IV fimbrial biogenesis protein FimT
MNQKGLTLVETLVVMALIAIILSFTVPFTLHMIRKSRAETEIRNLYGNLTEARQRALERSLPYVVQVTGSAANTNGVGSAIEIFEDRNLNGVLDTTPLPTENVANLGWAPIEGSHTPAYSLDGTVGTDDLTSVREITISTRGIMTPDAKIFMIARAGDDGVSDAAVNCIAVSITRIGLGKYDGTNCQIQ